MLLPGKLRIHTKSISKVWVNGTAWSVSEKSLLAFLRIAKDVGFRTCEECTPERPCESFARSISYWVNDLNARARFAEKKEEQAREKVRDPFRWKQKTTSADNRAKPRVNPKEQAAKTLGLSWPCTKEEATAAFRRLIVKAHPDLGGSADQARELIEARELLTA